jgi:polyhydroxyalkanoate synthesis regulator phasin
MNISITGTKLKETANMESIIDILIKRDNMTRESAMELINEAKEQLQEYLEEGDFEYAEDICREYFSLEPDYITELL